MMKLIALALLFFVVVLGGRFEDMESIKKMFPTRSAKIVNGERPSIEQIPWQVGIFDSHIEVAPICGGSIISSIWVVSAAHCIVETMKSGRWITHIRAGSVLSTGGSKHTLAERIYHPDYELRDETTIVAVNDIALIRVVEPFIFDATRQPVPLYNGAAGTLAEVEATASGWGVMNDNHHDHTSQPDYLKSATMKILSKEDCGTFLSSVFIRSQVPNGQICTTPVTGRTCYGDSGGPLTVNGTLVGIDSWMTKPLCNDTDTLVFTEVAHYRTWILKTTSI